MLIIANKTESETSLDIYEPEFTTSEKTYKPDFSEFVIEREMKPKMAPFAPQHKNYLSGSFSSNMESPSLLQCQLHLAELHRVYKTYIKTDRPLNDKARMLLMTVKLFRECLNNSYILNFENNKDELPHNSSANYFYLLNVWHLIGFDSVHRLRFESLFEDFIRLFGNSAEPTRQISADNIGQKILLHFLSFEEDTHENSILIQSTFKKYCKNDPHLLKVIQTFLHLNTTVPKNSQVNLEVDMDALIVSYSIEVAVSIVQILRVLCSINIHQNSTLISCTLKQQIDTVACMRLYIDSIWYSRATDCIEDFCILHIRSRENTFPSENAEFRLTNSIDSLILRIWIILISLGRVLQNSFHE